MSFWGELKRRNVYKVGVAYAIVAWLLIQFAAIAFPHLGFPPWAVPFVIIILIIGFPVVLIIAWAFEVTPEGIKRTKEVPLSESITHLTGRRLNYILAGVIVLAVAFILFDNYYLDRRVVEPEIVSTEIEQAPIVSDLKEAPKTIAVLPFVNLSPDPDQEYFVDGLSEELLNSLSQIPDLRVISRTSSFSFKGTNKTLQEVANALGVENILEGSVRKAGESLRITAQLIRATDDFHLWSKTYDRELKDIFAVQEDIATAVAGELKATLGVNKSIKQLGGTDNVEAYELYLAARAQSNVIQMSKRPFESIVAALELDPEFALAWALKAVIYHLPGVEGSVDQSLDEDLKAAQRAIDIEPNLPEGYAALGSCRMYRGDWIEAELAYRKARNFGNTSTLIDGNYPPFLFAVGYFDKGNKILEEALRNDPLSQRISQMYMDSFICLGDRQRAEEELNRYIALFSQGSDFKIRINFGGVSLDDMIREGSFSEEQIERIKSPEDYLVELRSIYTDLPVFTLLGYSTHAAYLGDPELALNIREITIRRTPGLIDGCWFPVMKEVRQLPQFKEVVKKIGLVDYWNKFGWPDICRPLENGDFECD